MLVMANFGLVLPVVLIKDLDVVQQEDQHRQLTNPGKFILEPIRENCRYSALSFQPVCRVLQLKSREYLTALPESLYLKFSRRIMASLVGSHRPNSLRSSSVNLAVELNQATLVMLDAP